MKTNTAFQKLCSVAVIAVALIGISVAPVLLSQNADAAPLTSRSITLSSSKLSQTSVTYSVSFNVTSTTNILGIALEICQNSPLLGLSCTTTNGISATPNSGTINVTKTGTGGTIAFNTTNSVNNGRLLLSHGTGFTSVLAGETITFSFTATNPSGTASSAGTAGTFYGRIATYSSAAGAQNYTSTAPGTHIDDGGVAMATANQLTISARVQEQLQFCVGGTTVNDATTSVSTDCSVAFTGSGTCGNTVDLGVVDNASSYVSPVSAATNGGNGCNGAAMVRTNAANGVVVTYFPEPDTSGTNFTRDLRVVGATCDGTASNTDRCFNSGASQTTLTAGTEEFGMTVAAINCGSTTSYTCTFTTPAYNLVRDAAYDGNGANTYVTDTGAVGGTTNGGYAWSASGTATTIASSAGSSTKVVDDETLMLKFAATSNITTPTGSYSVVSTYVATGTF
jgi:hypothetical protein